MGHFYAPYFLLTTHTLGVIPAALELHSGMPYLSTEHTITACAVATRCCISDVPFQWEGRNFDPPQLPHFSSDLAETQN